MSGGGGWFMREQDRVGAPLEPAATPAELVWWNDERRRLQWSYGLRQGIPMLLVFVIGGWLAASRHGLLTLPRLAEPLFVGITAAALSGYFAGRVVAESRQAMRIRQKRLREAMGRLSLPS